MQVSQRLRKRLSVETYHDYPRASVNRLEKLGIYHPRRCGRVPTPNQDKELRPAKSGDKFRLEGISGGEEKLIKDDLVSAEAFRVKPRHDLPQTASVAMGVRDEGRWPRLFTGHLRKR